MVIHLHSSENPNISTFISYLSYYYRKICKSMMPKVCIWNCSLDKQIFYKVIFLQCNINMYLEIQTHYDSKKMLIVVEFQ